MNHLIALSRTRIFQTIATFLVLSILAYIILYHDMYVYCEKCYQRRFIWKVKRVHIDPLASQFGLHKYECKVCHREDK